MKHRSQPQVRERYMTLVRWYAKEQEEIKKAAEEDEVDPLKKRKKSSKKKPACKKRAPLELTKEVAEGVLKFAKDAKKVRLKTMDRDLLW